MKLYISAILAALITITALPIYAQKEVSVTDEDVKWMLEGIDTQKGQIDLNSPKNEFQAIMSEFMSRLNKLNESFAEKSSLIGTYELSSLQQLKDKEVAEIFLKNIDQYRTIQKSHYDQLDSLLKENRMKTGKATEKKGRLEGTSQAYFEQMENKYLNDLSIFYMFVIENHSNITFNGDEVFLKTDVLVNEFNSKFNNAVESAEQLNHAHKYGRSIMTKSINEAKDTN